MVNLMICLLAKMKSIMKVCTPTAMMFTTATPFNCSGGDVGSILRECWATGSAMPSSPPGPILTVQRLDKALEISEII
jgi:hypothetical protein